MNFESTSCHAIFLFALRDALQPKLLSGELRVSDVDTLTSFLFETHRRSPSPKPSPQGEGFKIRRSLVARKGAGFMLLGDFGRRVHP